jgi:hypothetical protein
MKKIKFIIMKSLALLLIHCVAQAQTSPETIIGQTPELPPAQALAAETPEIEAFVAQIDRLRKLNDENLARQMPSETEIAAMREKAVANAEKQAKQLTGKSVAELQNLSEAEAQAIAEEAVNRQLKAAGLGNMSLDDLQKLEGKSDKEVMEAMMGAGAIPDLGLTPAELKAMESMTDTQIEAYMKQGDRMQRVQKAADKFDARYKQSKSPEIDVNVIMQAQEEQQKFMERSDSIRKLNEKERHEVAAQMRDAVYPRHRAALEKARRDAGECDGKTERSNEWCEDAFRRMRTVETAFRADCYSLWRNQIGKEQERLKTLLDDAKKLDAMQAKAESEQKKMQSVSGAGNLQVMPAIVGMNTAAVVNAYLGTAGDVLNLPAYDTEQ